MRTDAAPTRATPRAGSRPRAGTAVMVAGALVAVLSAVSLTAVPLVPVPLLLLLQAGVMVAGARVARRTAGPQRVLALAAAAVSLSPLVAVAYFLGISGD